MKLNINKVLNLRDCGRRNSSERHNYKMIEKLRRKLIETVLWMLFNRENLDIQFLRRMIKEKKNKTKLQAYKL